MARKFLKRWVKKIIRVADNVTLSGDNSVATRLSRKIFAKGVIFRKVNSDLVLLGETSKSDGYVISEIYGKDLYCFKDICALLGERGPVVDIGGHKGYFTTLAATKFPKVLAFEASEKNYTFLNENVVTRHGL